ncbi:MAG: aldo/keto reductase [Thermoplasmata archaeon]
MGRVKGLATPTGTARFRDAALRKKGIRAEHFRSTPAGLWLTSIGLGTYIGPPDSVTDHAVEQATQLSLASHRINVLDTAINYRYQRAERSLGRAIAREIEKGDVKRDEIFVSTKSGYFAPDGESKIPPNDWVEHELIGPGVLDPVDIVDGCHAMSVSYLTDQFERSRQNMGLDAIDLLYLHNAADAQLPVVGVEEFRSRLVEAIGLYEGYRTEGALGAYGLATWDCLRARRGEASYLSLESVVRLAEEVAGEDHGFRFIQFPFSLGMPEASQLKNQLVGGSKMTLFEAAQKLGIGCFTSVPLIQGQLARAGPKAEGLTSAQTAIQFARSVPGALATLVGQKSPEHIAENLQLATLSPWPSLVLDRLLA